MKKILLLSAYRSDSHALWSDWLTANLSGIDWQVLELPGRHFSWRIRGNPLSWINRMPTERPDLILATSMVDLATLKGLHAGLAEVPAIYYFHENQFAYPTSDHQITSIEAQMVQLYGALAADRLLFNSKWNHDSFLDGVDQLLARMPDQVPGDIRIRLDIKSAVLPVPVEPVANACQRDPRLIVWNHRWEYDKAPEVFTEAILRLAETGADFRLALLGARSQDAPEPLARLRQHLAGRIVADGRLPLADYRNLLGRAGIAVSTAIHEFQGISMLEAASAGAHPLVPDALCYPEQYPESCRYPPGDVEALARRLAGWLDNQPPPACKIDAWLAPSTAPGWKDILAGQSRCPAS